MGIGAEHRKHRRFDLSFPVRVRVKAQAASEIETATRDISGSGVYFTMARDVEPGSKLECELTLPPEVCQGFTVRLKSRARVVRVERHEEENKIGVAATFEHYEFIRTD